MNYYRRSELTPEALAALGRYDDTVKAFTGPEFSYPVRMRDWELLRILEALRRVPPGSRLLDTGSFNTYLPLVLRSLGFQVTASDLLWARRRKSWERRLGLAPAKATEVPFGIWQRIYRRAGVSVESLDLTRLDRPDGSVDGIVALSVIEHIPAIERSVAEMYRALAPGGRLLITSDCAPEPSPFRDGVRYLSESELEALFAPYPVTSARNRPDFSPENWCYGQQRPVVTVFVEITKPK